MDKIKFLEEFAESLGCVLITKGEVDMASLDPIAQIFSVPYKVALVYKGSN